MLMRRYEKLDPFVDMQRQMDRFFGPCRPTQSARAFPLMDVWEDEQNYFVEAELPGLRMEDLEIVVFGKELTIKGERKVEDEAPADKVTQHIRERGTGAFSRVIRMPLELDAEQAKAELKDGVLRVSLPKHAQSKPRRIELK